MMRKLILYTLFLSGWFSAPAQSTTDSVTCVFFHPVHDTVIVVTKDKYSSVKDLVYWKIYPDSDRTVSPQLDLLGIASSEEAGKSLMSLLSNTGYRLGENPVEKLDVAMNVKIKKQINTGDNSFVYVYNVCYAVSLPGDTLYSHCSSDQMLELWRSKNPTEDIKKSINFGTYVWQPVDRRLFYVFLYWEKPDYDSNTGNEYMVIMTQTMILTR